MLIVMPCHAFKVNYKVRLAGGTEVVSASPESGALFVLSSPGPEIPRGVVVALKSMKRGEKFLLRLKSECRFSDGIARADA